MEKYHGDEHYCTENNYCHCMSCEDEKYYTKQDLDYEAWADEFYADESHE